MDRIDKSSVSMRRSSVIVKHWVQQEPAMQEAKPPASLAVDQDEDKRIHAQEHAQQEEAGQNLVRLAKEHAAALVDQAQDQAEALLAAAQQESDAIRKSAYEEGLARGLEEAALQDEARAHAYEERFLALMQALQNREDERDAAMEHNILQLSLEISKKVVNISFDNDDNIFVGMIRDAIARLNAREKFAIHLNQREYDRFFAQDVGWLSETVQAAPFTVTVDASIAPGDILLTSQDGMVRGGVETQLGKLTQSLLPDEGSYANI